MHDLFVTQDEARVRSRGGRLVVEMGERGDVSLPIMKVRSLFVVGRGQVTTDALVALAQNDAVVVYCTKTGRTKAFVGTQSPSRPDLRIEQVRHLLDNARRLRIARAIVRAKLTNSLRVMDSRYRHGSFSGGDYARARSELERALAEVSDCPSVDELRGLEGRGARVYFSCLSFWVRSPFSFEGRERRPPRDPVNALLSLSYSLAAGLVTTVLNGSGLLHDIGYLHENYRNRPALSLDLLDPVRPTIDRFVLSVLNRGALSPEDFVLEEGACHLTDSGSRKFYPRLSEFFFGGNNGGPVGADGLAGVFGRMARRLESYLLGRADTIEFEDVVR